AHRTYTAQSPACAACAWPVWVWPSGYRSLAPPVRFFPLLSISGKVFSATPCGAQIEHTRDMSESKRNAVVKSFCGDADRDGYVTGPLLLTPNGVTGEPLD